MHLPFFNRQNYVVLKCYTPIEVLNKYKTLELSSKNLKVKESEHSFDRLSQKTNFKSCYGMLHSLSRSVSLNACQEFKVACDGTNVKYESPSNIMDYETEAHNRDSFFNPGNSIITKIIVPWQIEEKTGAKFVYARHIQNTSFMNIPSGVVSFNNGHSLNVFNYVPKIEIKYKVNFLHPLTSLYLLDDKKLVVETYVDANKYTELSNATMYQRLFFKGNLLKREKLDKLNQAKKMSE